MKTKRNVTFLEARKFVGSYMGEKGYASVARRADRNYEDNKYWTLVEKSIQLEANEWLKFQDYLEKLHSAEFCSAKIWKWREIQCWSPNKNRSRIYFSISDYSEKYKISSKTAVV